MPVQVTVERAFYFQPTLTLFSGSPDPQKPTREELHVATRTPPTIRLVRVCAVLLLGVGALAILSQLIAPLRSLWPAFRKLPMPIQVGVGCALFGLLLLFGSLIWERMEEREQDRALLDDDTPTPPSTGGTP